jgi:hypothetical protein
MWPAYADHRGGLSKEGGSKVTYDARNQTYKSPLTDTCRTENAPILKRKKNYFLKKYLLDQNPKQAQPSCGNAFEKNCEQRTTVKC